MTIQPDMELVGVADTAADYRGSQPSELVRWVGSTAAAVEVLEDAGSRPAGGLAIRSSAWTSVDATPKQVGATNAPTHDARRA
ncbi:MAG: hypothetical protein U0V56_06780 [Actinomycetota bacterium]